MNREISSHISSGLLRINKLYHKFFHVLITKHLFFNLIIYRLLFLWYFADWNQRTKNGGRSKRTLTKPGGNKMKSITSKVWTIKVCCSSKPIRDFSGPKVCSMNLKPCTMKGTSRTKPMQRQLQMMNLLFLCLKDLTWPMSTLISRYLISKFLVHIFNNRWRWCCGRFNFRQRTLELGSHLCTAVAWREKNFKHFVFNKYFFLVLGVLKSKISKKSFEHFLRTQF